MNGIRGSDSDLPHRQVGIAGRWRLSLRQRAQRSPHNGEIGDRGHPIWSLHATAIDTSLISGIVIFGIGCRLAGYCPRPEMWCRLPAGERSLRFRYRDGSWHDYGAMDARGLPAVLPYQMGQS